MGLHFASLRSFTNGEDRVHEFVLAYGSKNLLSLVIVDLAASRSLGMGIASPELVLGMLRW